LIPFIKKINFGLFLFVYNDPQLEFIINNDEIRILLPKRMFEYDIIAILCAYVLYIGASIKLK
jgi:hypothetical protein